MPGSIAKDPPFAAIKSGYLISSNLLSSEINGSKASRECSGKFVLNSFVPKPFEFVETLAFLAESALEKHLDGVVEQIPEGRHQLRKHGVAASDVVVDAGVEEEDKTHRRLVGRRMFRRSQLHLNSISPVPGSSRDLPLPPDAAAARRRRRDVTAELFELTRRRR